jgi:hypothetical protein
VPLLLAFAVLEAVPPPLRFGAASQKIRCLLRVAGCGEYRPLVVLQSFQPSGDIGRVVVPDLRDKLKVGAQESRAKLGNKLLHRIALIAKPLSLKIPVKAARVLRPVGAFMRKGAVIGSRVPEAFKGRHLYVIERGNIVGAVPAVPHVRAGRGKECLGFRYALLLVQARAWVAV